jgi:hypothetical protein
MSVWWLLIGLLLVGIAGILDFDVRLILRDAAGTP